MIVLGGIYCGAIFGGSISAILIHTPGTPASAATAIEGYELTKTIKPVAWSIPKVTGSRRATPIAADKPGRQPIVIPSAVAPIIRTNVRGFIAWMKPMPIKESVSNMASSPRGLV